MSKVSGNAKRYNESPIDYVMLYDWASGNHILTIYPNAEGVWEYEYFGEMTVGIAYVADGCQPITHGPYNLASVWTPEIVFSEGKLGIFYDPSDITSLFKDDAGLQPVTADGDIVRLMLDKSGSGNHARCGAPQITGITSTVNGMRYRTNGNIHWLERIDDDSGFIADPIIKSGNFSSFFALDFNDMNDSESLYFQQGFTATRIMLYGTRAAGNARQITIFDNNTKVTTGQLNTNPHIYSTIHNNSTRVLTTEADNLGDINITSMTNSYPQKQVDFMRRVVAYKGRWFGAIMIDGHIATDDERYKIKTYLAGKSGITI